MDSRRLSSGLGGLFQSSVEDVAGGRTEGLQAPPLETGDGYDIDTVNRADSRSGGRDVPTGDSAIQPRFVPSGRCLRDPTEASDGIRATDASEKGTALTCCTERSGQFRDPRHKLGAAVSGMRL